MKTRVMLFVIFSLTVVALGLLVTVIFNTTPTTNEALSLFYISLFVSLAGAIFLLTYVFLRLKYGTVPPWSSTATALRLSIALALYVSLIMLLKSQGLLNEAIAILLLIIVAIAELYGRRLNFKGNN